MPTKNLVIDFSDMSGGKNKALPRHALQPDQVNDTLNLIHEKIGVGRAPGYYGDVTAALFAGACRGAWSYKHADGTETLIVAANSKIWSVSLSASPWEATDRYTLSADTACYAVNLAGKLWICNGTDFVKVEDDLTVYRVEIAAPTGTSATATAGGTLAAGVYGCYASYARQDSNGQWLYSYPYSLGNKTCTGAGNQTITFVIPDSSDPQVTHKVFWMTDADGSVQYFYGSCTNATASLTITSAANRNASKRMDILAAPNEPLTITPDGIFTFDDKLYVWDAGTRVLYWSLKTDVNPNDLERFLAANFRQFSVAISSAFSVGNDLFINAVGNGIVKVPSGDMSAIVKLIERRLWFKPLKTEEGRSYVCGYKGIVFGWTNDGVRYFNGESFSDDLSFSIKPDIDGMTAGADATWLPSACVNRRSGKRTELRFAFRDTNISSNINNAQILFNLDFYFGATMAADGSAAIGKKTWERWESGFSDQVILSGQWVGIQSLSSESSPVMENGAADILCYNTAGAWLTAKKTKNIYILTRTVIDRLDAISIWGTVYTMATSQADIGGNMIIFDAAGSIFPFVIKGSLAGTAILPPDGEGSLPLPFVMGADFPVGTAEPIAFAARGNSVALEINQDADDPTFFLYMLQLPKIKEIINNLT